MVKGNIQFIEHHRSHLKPFYPSPYDEAAILSIDGSGDFTTTMLGRGEGTNIEVLESVDFPASVGLRVSFWVLTGETTLAAPYEILNSRK